MAEGEKQTIEYKSIQKIRTGDKGFRDLAVTCVSLANAQGGKIFVGYDDKGKCPLLGQVVDIDEVNDAVSKLRSLCFNVAVAASEVQTDEDIQRLSEEKGTYQWEIVRTKFILDESVLDNLHRLAEEIRRSPRVAFHIKQLDDIELAEHYCLMDAGQLTHLGVLWLGTSKQRQTISYPITAQYIVYDNLERKVRKVEWHDNALNPKELLLSIEKEAIELTYSYEFPDGLFRKQIRHYHPKLIRELLVNAFAHKSFTISSDIMIQVYPDRLEISNPGGLPLGITKDNILHTKHRRNPHFIEILSALELMEGEGSGYDLIYELNSMEAKHQPAIESSYNEVRVIQPAEIIDRELLPLLDYVLQNYRLTQKGYIAFGIIARERKILSTQLSAILQLSEEERLRSYTDKLVKDNIVCRKGVKKGSFFSINPQLIKNAKVNLVTTLKTLEPHALKALIMEDLKLHPGSRISEIARRLPEADIKDLRKIIYPLVNKELRADGAKSERRYWFL